MITAEQLKQASERAMIALDGDEFPVLLHALRQMEPLADLLTQAVDFTDAPASTYAASFPDALRPDLPIPFSAHQTIFGNVFDAQGGYFTVRQQLLQEEDCP